MQWQVFCCLFKGRFLAISTLDGALVLTHKQLGRCVVVVDAGVLTLTSPSLLLAYTRICPDSMLAPVWGGF